MYKSKLQELCQKKTWAMPEYTSVKLGLSHNPRFTATVTVQGLTFETPVDQCRSSKEAQNLAAQRAFDHFTGLQTSLQPLPQPIPQPQPQTPFPSLAGSSSPSTNSSHINQPSRTGETPLACGNGEKPKDVLHLYKNKLQNYAQKHLLDLPIYSYEYDGPPHSRKFRAKVTFCGKTYESSEFLSTVKDAEVAAAKVAFDSLPQDYSQEDEVLYKNLLQELAQKEGIVFPSYITIKSGPSHMPTFIATVEIGCEVFQGEEAQTKKQAEIKAAKVAYNALTQRIKLKEPVVNSSSSSSERFVDPTELFQNIQPNAQLFVNKEMIADVQDRKRFRSSYSSDTGSESMGLKYPKDVFVVPEYEKPAVEDNSGPRKIIVYSRNSDMQIPDGASVLPISDDKWVAVTMDLNQLNQVE